MNVSSPLKHTKNSFREGLFRFITLSLPVIILLLLEGGLRLLHYGDNLNLFIENPKEGYEEYLIVNPDIGKKYFQKFEYDTPPNDIFLKKKPQGTVRIFVVGSSTVYGFPFHYNLMFSRILHKRLRESYPYQHIEVVNTAITAVNSHTLRDFSGEILKYDPDAVLVYAGHNEFYGAFGTGSNESMSKSRILTRLHLRFMDLRFYQLFRNMAGSIGKMGSGKQDKVHGTLMKRIVANKSIPLESADFRLAMTRYRQNMEALVQTFTEKEIPLFLSEVVSNVKDIKPFSAVTAGVKDGAWDAYAGAVKAYNQAAYEEARDLFYKAKELDAVRFRASEEVNSIIRELSMEYGSYDVSMLNHFQAASPHGIIGNNLMTEHVHPNIEGNFLMADAFYSEIVQSGIFGEVDTSRLYPSEYYKINWGYTALDSLQAHHRIANLKSHWPFVRADNNSADYRLSYRPKSKVDSIAFTAFKDPGQSIDELRLELARWYEARGDHYAAYREYEALLCTNPYLAVNYRDAASSLIRLGHLPLALEYFKRSLAYEPSYYAHFRMGEIYFIKGDYLSARRSFEEAFAIAPQKSDKLKTLGKLYISCLYGGQDSDAKAIAGQLKQYDAAQYLNIPPKQYTYNKYIPYKTKNQVLTAIQLRSEGRFTEAISLLESSLNLYDSHVAQRLLGEIWLEVGNNHKALYHLNRAAGEFAFDPGFSAVKNQAN
ncbi:MAG: tetratricopeptide repeat protein [Bacteroidota bacterium]